MTAPEACARASAARCTPRRLETLAMSRQQLQITGTLAVGFFLAAIVACNGFFVNPTLSSITVTPSNPTLQSVNQTVQLTATGTFDDGSTKNLTASSSTTWSSSDPTAVTVNNAGLVKVVSITGPSSVTITATNSSSSGAVSGTTTICIGTTCAAS